MFCSQNNNDSTQQQLRNSIFVNETGYIKITAYGKLISEIWEDALTNFENIKVNHYYTIGLLPLSISATTEIIRRYH